SNQQWFADHHGTRRDGRAGRRSGEIAFRPEHNPRRRLRALHRTPAARRTGQSLRFCHAAKAGATAMNRMLAIVEREMRKFFRSPTLMMASMIFPLVQLIVLGNAFGGKIRDAKMGVVDQDGGTQALKIREA